MLYIYVSPPDGQLTHFFVPPSRLLFSSFFSSISPSLKDASRGTSFYEFFYEYALRNKLALGYLSANNGFGSDRIKIINKIKGRASLAGNLTTIQRSRTSG
jgi:hypothetical protein